MDKSRASSLLSFMVAARSWFVSGVIVFAFSSIVYAGQAQEEEKKTSETPKQEDPHATILKETPYPSASQCKECHEQIYNEWRSSSHAYASISPVFHKFDQKINDLAQGTVGTFCVRCHAGVGTVLNEPREMPLWERNKVSREGVTCISCHRINEEYNQVNAERRIIPGDIHQPMAGSSTGEGLEKVLKDKDFYKVKTSSEGPGKEIHTSVFKFEQITKSEFCVSCHQVAVYPGIKLEVVWDQYRASPAAKNGVSCQDCHMGKTPGVNAGKEIGPAAIISGTPINPERKHSNHAFAGPGYPIAHPGIFPHNVESEQFPIQAWLKFDYRAGWGKSEFEEKVEKAQPPITFPKEWENSVDREEARRIIEDNITKIEEKKELRRKVMENGSRIDGPNFTTTPTVGKTLKFNYKVTNTNPGHNLPSGSLGAQPELWLNVALINPDGKTVWESGYLDSNGDMADLHSLDVAQNKIEHDDQLFNLQTKFLTTNVKGTDREMYLPVNLDIDQIPFIRPAGQPITVMNHPPFIRMEGRSLSPLGSRLAKYSASASVMDKPGKYKLAVRLRSRAEPIYFMKFIGATREMEQAMNEWMLDLHAYTVEFEVK